MEVFTIKFHPSAYFALLGKIYSPFCLQNCLFLLVAYFAQNSAGKFRQGLIKIGGGGMTGVASVIPLFIVRLLHYMLEY